MPRTSASIPAAGPVFPLRKLSFGDGLCEHSVPSPPASPRASAARPLLVTWWLPFAFHPERSFWRVTLPSDSGLAWASGLGFSPGRGRRVTRKRPVLTFGPCAGGPPRLLPTAWRRRPGALGALRKGAGLIHGLVTSKGLPFRSATFDTVPARVFVGTQSLRASHALRPGAALPGLPAPLGAPGVGAHGVAPPGCWVFSHAVLGRPISFPACTLRFCLNGLLSFPRVPLRSGLAGWRGARGRGPSPSLPHTETRLPRRDRDHCGTR